MVNVLLEDGRKVKVKQFIKSDNIDEWRVVIEYENSFEYHKISDIKVIGGTWSIENKT